MKVRTSAHHQISHSFFFFLFFLIECWGCGPGRSYYNPRKGPRKMTPLVFKQHVPNLHEFTLGASGHSEGKITRSDPEFKALVVNNNPALIFKDRRNSRFMSKRCNEMLNTLAILVSEQWPGLRVRVLRAWEGGNSLFQESLHYEGRAVDISTSDRDRAKYGMLGRLAVEAGFDWVHYVSRSYIHCSVKSDTSIAVRAGGCFPSSSFVYDENWNKIKMKDLKVGQKVWTAKLVEGGSEGWLKTISMWFKNILRWKSSHFQRRQNYFFLTEIIAFLHRDELVESKFMQFEFLNDQCDPHFKNFYMNNNFHFNSSIFNQKINRCEKKETFRTTPQHLIYAINLNNSQKKEKFVFASDFSPLHHSIYSIKNSLNTRKLSHKKLSISSPILRKSQGLYAPLTSQGTLIVDGVLVSCYASLSNHNIAHFSMAPLRNYYHLKKLLFSLNFKPINFNIFHSIENFYLISLKSFAKNIKNSNFNQSQNYSTQGSKKNKKFFSFSFSIHPYANFLLKTAELFNIL